MIRDRVLEGTWFSAEAYEKDPVEKEIEKVDVEKPPTAEYAPDVVTREPYVVTDGLEEVVNLAIALGRPLLLQGEPGCGKTRLAYAIAYALKLPLEVCDIKSISRAQDLLYTYDVVRRLYEAQLGAAGIPMNGSDAGDIRRYIRLGPLGRAIARGEFGRQSVVLIDEIDQADLDFPNDLLSVLDYPKFSIAEAPDMSYSIVEDRKVWPIIVVTHNEEKALPPAFLRRCIFHYINFPNNPADLKAILAKHVHREEPMDALADGAISIVDRVRKLDDLSRKPGLSELIDWVGYLAVKSTPVDHLKELPYADALIKQKDDQERARKELRAQ